MARIGVISPGSAVKDWHFAKDIRLRPVCGYGWMTLITRDPGKVTCPYCREAVPNIVKAWWDSD